MILQRFTLADGLWSCPGCGANIVDGVMAHQDGCPEMGGVTGKAEYAWLEPDGTVFELVTFSEEAARAMTVGRERYGNPAALVRRTVTYGEWEECP